MVRVLEIDREIVAMRYCAAVPVTALLALAALASVDAECACSEANCESHEYDSKCVLAVVGDWKVIGNQSEVGCGRYPAAVNGPPSLYQKYFSEECQLHGWRSSIGDLWWSSTCCAGAGAAYVYHLSLIHI